MLNPFLEPRTPIAFDTMSADQIAPAFDVILAEASRRLTALVTGPAAPCAETLAALDDVTRELDYAASLAEHLEEVLGTPAYRQAQGDALRRRNLFYSAMQSSEPLYRVLRRFVEADPARALSLSDANARFLDRTLASLEREGAAVGTRDRERLAEIDAAIGELTLRFAQNADDAAAAFALRLEDPSRLAGVPQAAVEAMRAAAAARGDEGWRLTLDGPAYLAVLTHAEDRALRKELYLAKMTRASGHGDGAEAAHDNRPLMRELLELRQERARILGFSSFADYATSDRMMKSGQNALDFVSRLAGDLTPSFHRETAELESFARRGGCDRLEAWDVAFWAEKQRREVYRLDAEALRPWFPLDGVLRGLFDVVTTLFGVRFEPAPSAPLWHPDVTAFDLRDENGAHLGIVYLDLYVRAGKRSGAWMSPLLDANGAGMGAAVLALNATRPRSASEPALLSHPEVRSLFHELGHVLHHLLSMAPIRKLSGVRVAWDFVELPSMLMENFAWDARCLDRIGRHWQTGAPLPDAAKEALSRSRTYRASSELMRSLGLAMVDLRLHASYDATGRDDVTSFAREVLAPFMPTTLPDEYAMVATFSHLFGSTNGYEAAYYAYAWAEVLDADAFEAFVAAGPLRPTIGAAFRREILSRGNTADPGVLFRAFIGRDPDRGALARRMGLATPAEAR